MKKCAVIYNPNSGKHIKEDFTKDFIKILNNHDYEVDFIYTEYKYHAFKIIEDLKDDVSLVISIGGDGTFNEIMTGNLKRKKRLLLAHIPLGTANDLGAMFGYSKNIVNNLKLLLDGCVKGIDICIVNDRPFVYVAGFGKFLDVSYLTTSKMKRKWGYLAYLYNGLKSFFDKTNCYELTYTVNGETYRGKYSFALISNANRIAGINNFYKDIYLDDDTFEVLFCSLTKKKDIIKAVIGLKTSGINNVAGMYFHKTNKLSIKFDSVPKNNWCVDGEELIDKRKTYNISVIHDVKIMLPKKNVASLFIKK